MVGRREEGAEGGRERRKGGREGGRGRGGEREREREREREMKDKEHVHNIIFDIRNNRNDVSSKKFH